MIRASYMYIFGRMTAMSTPEISIVIIGRNEEATIGKNLDILVPEASRLNAEVVVVDSGSSDRTFAIARQYPVTVVRLDDSPLRSPAAARYIGTLHTHGKYIYYMDGDMILIPHWLEEGMRHLKDSSVGGVAGRMLIVEPGEELARAREDGLPLGDVETLHTSGMYRRDVLEKTYTFNPYLKGEEERELGYRIQQAGFRLVRVPTPMGYHVFKELTTAVVDRKAGYWAGQGQIFRRYPITPLARTIASESIPTYTGIAVLYGPAVLLLIALSGFLSPSINLVLFGIVGIAVLGLVALILRKGPQKVFLYLRQRYLISFHLVRGFILGLPDPPGFEQRVKFTMFEAKHCRGDS